MRTHAQIVVALSPAEFAVSPNGKRRLPSCEVAIRGKGCLLLLRNRRAGIGDVAGFSECPNSVEAVSRGVSHPPGSNIETPAADADVIAVGTSSSSAFLGTISDVLLETMTSDIRQPDVSRAATPPPCDSALWESEALADCRRRLLGEPTTAHGSPEPVVVDLQAA